MHDKCMAIKPITIDLEAYEALARHKRKGESFSRVIKEHFGRRSTGRDLAALLPETGMGDLGTIRTRTHSGVASAALGRGGHGTTRDRARPTEPHHGRLLRHALCESFFATLQCDLLERRRFRTQDATYPPRWVAASAGT
ncbi:MAG: antitoxin VapB family protein [Candidatus Methylomirabilis sp.]